jgi:hypothetical protein
LRFLWQSPPPVKKSSTLALRPAFNNMVCPQGWSLPLGVNCVPRGMFTPIQGITSPLGDKLKSWGTTSPLGVKVCP